MKTQVIRFIALLLIPLLVVGSGVAGARHGNGDRDNRSALTMALRAVGGENALRDLESFRFGARGVRWVLDEGEVPGEGASNRGTFALDMVYDVAGDRLRIDYSMISAFGVERTLSEIVDGELGFRDGQDNNFAPPGQSAMLSDRVMSIRKHQRLMNPHLILLDILANPSLATDLGIERRRWRRYHVLQVDDPVAPLKLYINARSGRLERLTTMESDPLRRDVPLEVRYGRWRSAGDGLRFPKLVLVKYDGEVVQKEFRTRVRANRAVDEERFEIPEDIEPVFDPDLAFRGELNHQHLQSFAALGFPRDGIQPDVVGTEVAPGVFHLTGGSHHSMAIRQGNGDGGVVIVDMPQEEIRAAALIEWVATNIGLPITHAIQSHHHADHSAGIRTFAATGATIVAHEAAVGLYERVFTAPSDLAPDDLAALPGSPDIEISPVPADGSLTVEDSTNPVTVFPFADHANDQTIIEAGGVVFVVDSYSPNPSATGLPPGGIALYRRIVELELEIDAIAGGHGGVIDFALFEMLALQDEQ